MTERGRIDAKPRRKLPQALAQLSDAEWAQVKDAEQRRRADQHRIRDLSAKLHALRRGGAA